MGVSQEYLYLLQSLVTNFDSSITKLMGESFKLHSQALIGYEDALMAEAEAERMHSSPDATIPPHAAEVAAY